MLPKSRPNLCQSWHLTGAQCAISAQTLRNVGEHTMLLIALTVDLAAHTPTLIVFSLHNRALYGIQAHQSSQFSHLDCFPGQFSVFRVPIHASWRSILAMLGIYH